MREAPPTLSARPRLTVALCPLNSASGGPPCQRRYIEGRKLWAGCPILGHLDTVPTVVKGIIRHKMISLLSLPPGLSSAHGRTGSALCRESRCPEFRSGAVGVAVLADRFRHPRRAVREGFRAW